MPTRAARGEGGVAGKGTMTYASVLVLARAFQDPDDGLYYVESPHLDIISAGTTPEAARAKFDECIKLTLDDWSSDGVLRRRLADRGFTTNTMNAGNCDVVLMLPPGVEIEQTAQPTNPLPSHYQIQSMPYDVNMEAACMA